MKIDKQSKRWRAVIDFRELCFRCGLENYFTGGVLRSLKLRVMAIQSCKFHSCLWVYALFADLKLDWSTTKTTDCSNPLPICSVKSVKNFFPKKQANWPAFSLNKTFHAERRAVITVSKVPCNIWQENWTRILRPWVERLNHYYASIIVRLIIGKKFKLS